MGRIGNLHSKLYYATCLLGADFQPHWWAAPRRLGIRIVRGREGVDQATMCGSHKENGHMSPVCWAAVSAVSNYPETQIPPKLVYRGIFASAMPQIKGKFHFSCQFRSAPKFHVVDRLGRSHPGRDGRLFDCRWVVSWPPSPLPLSLWCSLYKFDLLMSRESRPYEI